MRTRTRITFAGFVLALALAGGVAWAAIPAGSGTIQGCYKKENGQLRVVEASSACRASEIPISWNQQGPAGAIGAQGPKGDTGAAGPAGAVGAIGPRGTAGADGAKGEPCRSSEPACVGPKGDTGAPGLKGETGLAGADGLQGLKGDTGAAGLQGAAGAKGDPCLASDPACVGPKGEKGDKGDPGAAGESCLPKYDACRGPKGDQGDPGKDGAACLATNPACVGPPGPPGSSGSGGAVRTTMVLPFQNTSSNETQTVLSTSARYGTVTGACFRDIHSPGTGVLMRVFTIWLVNDTPGSGRLLLVRDSSPDVHLTVDPATRSPLLGNSGFPPTGVGATAYRGATVFRLEATPTPAAGEARVTAYGEILASGDCLVSVMTAGER